MTVYRHQGRKWVYSFEHKKIRYHKYGFASKREAQIAEVAHRQQIELEKGVIKRAPLVNTKETDLDEFRKKYRQLAASSNNTLPDLFDMLMIDINIPYRFKDILQIAQNFKKSKIKIPAKLRTKILIRDNYTCQMCGAKAPEIKVHVDHVIPASRGGLTEEKNLRVLCESCNLGKSNFQYHIEG